MVRSETQLDVSADVEEDENVEEVQIISVTTPVSSAPLLPPPSSKPTPAGGRLSNYLPVDIPIATSPLKKERKPKGARVKVYSKEDLQRAYTAYYDEKKSLRESARTGGVPLSTLQDHVKHNRRDVDLKLKPGFMKLSLSLSLSLSL